MVLLAGAACAALSMAECVGGWLVVGSGCGKEAIGASVGAHAVGLFLIPWDAFLPWDAVIGSREQLT
jgi:hypothetical protein